MMVELIIVGAIAIAMLISIIWPDDEEGDE